MGNKAMLADAIFFWIFSVVLIGSALSVVIAKNPVHSVLFLILVVRQRRRDCSSAWARSSSA